MFIHAYNCSACVSGVRRRILVIRGGVQLKWVRAGPAVEVLRPFARPWATDAELKPAQPARLSATAQKNLVWPLLC